MHSKKKEKWELQTIRIITDKTMLESFHKIFKILELKMINLKFLQLLIDKMKEVNKREKMLNNHETKWQEAISEEALNTDQIRQMKEET